MTLGSTTEGGEGLLVVDHGGTFTTGTGDITINPTGAVRVGMVGGGAFHANGDIVVNGGTLILRSGEFSHAPGRSLTATVDAEIEFDVPVVLGEGTTWDIADLASFVDLEVGGENGDVATLNIARVTNRGPLTIGKTRVVNIGSETADGVYDCGNCAGTAGDVVVDGGLLNLGHRPLSASSFGDAGLTARNDAQVDFGNYVEETGGRGFMFENGADFSLVGFDIRGRRVTIDGVGSTLNVPTMGVENTLRHFGFLTLQNGAVGNIGGSIVLFGDGDEGARLLVLSGARLNSGTLIVREPGDGETLLRVEGAGSTIIQSDAAELVVEGVFSGVGKLEVADDGAFVSGMGPINVTGGARISVGTFGSGGTFHARGPMSVTGGRIEVSSGTFQAGTISLDTGETFDRDGTPIPVPSRIFLNNGMLEAEAISLTDGSELVISGGTFTGGILRTGEITATSGGIVRLSRTTVGALQADRVLIAGGGIFEFEGGRLQVGTFDGSLVNQGGTLAPGTSAGATHIAEDYTQQTGGVLEIEIGGTSAGQSHDLVIIAGGAILGGELQLKLLDGFVPSAADTFRALEAGGGIFSAFDNVATGERLDVTDRDGSFRVHYGQGSEFAINQIVLSDFIRDGTLLHDVNLFYNNSAFDGNGSDVSVADFAAIALDKSPLLAESEAGFANISGYSRGINGIFVDATGLPDDGAGIDASDFRFRIGNDDDADSWEEGPEPTAVGVLPGLGEGGADRIFVTFADGAVTDTWLRMTIEAGADTGLAADADFFFGSAAGETGAGFQPDIVGVDAADLQRIALELTPLAESGTELITQVADLNRDRTVDAFDFQVVALNLNPNVLQLITPQLSAAAGPAAVPEPSALLLAGLGLVLIGIRQCRQCIIKRP